MRLNTPQSLTFAPTFRPFTVAQWTCIPRFSNSCHANLRNMMKVKERNIKFDERHVVIKHDTEHGMHF